MLGWEFEFRLTADLAALPAIEAFDDYCARHSTVHGSTWATAWPGGRT